MYRNLPKIGFLLGSTSSHGGIERVTSILTDQLIEKELAHIFAISYLPRISEDQVYKWNEKVSFYELLVKSESMKTGIFKALPKLRNYIIKNKIDVLVACGHAFGPLAGLATFNTKIRMAYWSHSSLFGEEVRPFKKFNEHLSSFLANTVISLTKTDEENYRNRTLAKKVFHIYNPLDEKLFINPSIYNPNTKKIISVGRLNEQKKFHTHLIEVAKIVLRNNPDYTWHIYGKGELENIIKANINEMGLAKRLILEGNVANLYELYSNHSLMVMTSAFEGFPMSLLEGMAKKLPLISFDIQTGPNEIIQDNVNGFLIKPFDCSAMANKIQELINNQEMRVAFSKANETMISPFKMEHVLKQWTSLIDNLTKYKS